jgi:fucose permease
MLTYAASATITPICLVLVVREFSLSLSAGGGLEVARSVLITAILLLSPWMAGHFGKALSLGVSALVVSLGTVLYALAPNYGFLLLALALIGTGGGVLEGLINPLVQDVAPPRQSGRWLNAVNGFWSVGVLFTMLGAGEWLTRGGAWRAPVLGIGLAGLVASVGFIWAWRALPRPVSTSPGEVWRATRGVLSARGFWIFVPMMFFAGAAEGAFTFWSASFAQLEFAGDPRAGGVATACFAAGMIAGRFAASVWVPQAALCRLIMVSAALGVGVAGLAPFVGNLAWFYAVLTAAGLCTACFWPSIQGYAADRVKGDSTVLFILLSVAGIPGFAAASWLLGALGDELGLRLAFVAVAPMFLGVLGLLLVERRRVAE